MKRDWLSLFWRITIGLQCLLLVLWMRLGFVNTYRQELIDSIHACARTEADGQWEWRYRVYRSVSFDRMMMQFYKPLSWFYPDDGFSKCRAADPVLPARDETREQEE